MRHGHDIKDEATDAEAMEAIEAGLTPMKVQMAVLSQTRAETASEYGFERNTITRLALRWPILGEA